MSKKRKIEAEEPCNANKRRTRSMGPLPDTPLVLVDSPKRARRKNHENDKPTVKPSHVKKDCDDEDELLLSPSKTRLSKLKTPSRGGTTRYILRSVEITTPSNRSSKHPQSDPGSPTSIPRTNNRLAENVALSTDSPHSPRKRKTRQSASLVHPKASPKPSTPSPKKTPRTPCSSPSRLPRKLPQHLRPCLHAQKRAVLRALQDPRGFQIDHDTEDEVRTNDVTFQQLLDLLNGTVARGEGNSCLLLGPRGSGKTSLVERCLTSLSKQPIVIRLSGWAQSNDRLAMREIAWQLAQQTGNSFLSKEEEESSVPIEDTNPFGDVDQTLSNPSSSHLPALISVIPTLSRPTVIILDGFDRFALHPRQSLLYCLLDTAQSCQVGQGNKGIAVIGVTSRVDTINLLEKRVKSRFSGRILRTAAPRDLMDWTAIARNILCVPIEDDSLEEDSPEWPQLWEKAVDDFLADQKVVNALADTFALAGDIRMLSRLLTAPILELGPSSPFPSAHSLTSAVVVQRCRHRYPYLHTLPYPPTCLLVAAMHAQTAGNDVFTFEMLHECFRDQLKSSTSAPVQIEGGGIGMMRCSREVLMSAFEQLESIRAFVPVAAPSTSISREFVRYRCTVERDAVKKAVEKMGQTNVRKWLNKAQ